MKDHKNTPKTNEEFSAEFGDINGMKLYEIPLMQQKKEKKETFHKQKK